MTQTPDAQLTIEGVFRLIKSGQFGPAEEICHRILESSPNDVNALGLLGAILLKLGRPADARPVLEKAIRLEPQFAKPHEDLGYLFLQARNHTQAVRYFETSINLDDSQPSAWSGLANAYLLAGDETRARKAREKFLERSPSGRALAEAHGQRRVGNAAEAERICEDVLKSDPGNSDAMRMLASIATADERYVVAEGLLKRLAKLSADHYLAHSELGRFLGDRGRIPEAIDEMQVAARLGPDIADNHKVLGDLLSVVGRVSEAHDAYREALRVDPENTAAIAGRGHTLRILGQSDEAIAAYEDCTERRPEIGDPWWSLATMRGYKFSAPQIEVMKSQLKSPDNEENSRINLAFALARVAESQDRYDDAWAYYEQGNGMRRGQVKYDPVQTEIAHNATIHACDEDLFEHAPATDFESPGPVFILGMPRSGSTLVEQILSSHSMVEGCGELPYIVMLTSTLRDPNDDDTHYPEAMHRMSAEQLRAIGESYLYHTRSHRNTDLPFFTDKMPANFAHVGLIHLALPQARIIDARRHPLDTCIGNYRQLFAQGKNMTYDLFEMAEYYLEYHRLMEHWDETLPGRVLRVRYEDVVEDLEGQTRRMLDYCGLPWEDACLEFHRNDRPVNTASAEQVRRPIYAESVNYWKNYEDHLQEIKDILANV